MKTIKLNFSIFSSWDTFHKEFIRIFGFPGYYGKNMDAWIDCMSYIDDPEAGMTTFNIGPDENLEFIIERFDYTDEIMDSVVFRKLALCCFFVNRRFKDSESKSRFVITL